MPDKGASCSHSGTAAKIIGGGGEDADSGEDQSPSRKNARMSKHFDVLILGGGVAGGYAAKELVKVLGSKSNGGGIGLLSKEEVLPYERPALSKGYLVGKAKHPNFNCCVGSGGEALNEEWYKKSGVETFLKTLVTSLDATKKVVTATTRSSSSNQTFTYDKLIYALGCSALDGKDIKLKGYSDALQSIYTLRDIEDAQKIYNRISSSTTKHAVSAVCIGGGYIGMEVAACMKMMNCDVTIIHPEKHLMEKFFPPEVSQYYEAAYKARGVQIVSQKSVQEVKANAQKEVTGVVLDDGDVVDCNLVVIGVGARPCADDEGVARDLKKRDGAIEVDENFKTNHPDVYAVGDCANFPNAFQDGQRTRIEHVSHARSSAEHAARHLTSSSSPSSSRAGKGYSYVPYFYSRVFDFSWKFWGLTEGADDIFVSQPDTTALNTSAGSSSSPSSGDSLSSSPPPPSKIAAIWVKNKRVIGAFIESGSEQEEQTIRAMGENKLNIEAKWENLKKSHSASQLQVRDILTLGET